MGNQDLLCETLADGLAALGYQIQAKASTVTEGLQSVESVPCDFALVDVSLKGEMASPIMDKQRDRGIPFLLATGTDGHTIPARHCTAPRLFKPFDLNELRQAVDSLVSGIGSPAGT